MKRNRPAVVKAAAQMWPRAVFDFDDKVDVKGCLERPGVYVLFRDDEPYYIGKTQAGLFEVLSSKHRDEIEGVLIASMPTAANSAAPKIKRIGLPKTVAQLMRNIRRQAVEFDE
jgi:hypothetical protein